MTTSTDPLPPAGPRVRPAFGPDATPSGDLSREHARARAAGYAAGWSQGSQAAHAAAERDLRARCEQLDAEAAVLRSRLEAALHALDDATRQLRGTVAPAVDDVADVVTEVGLGLAAAVLGHEPVAAADPGRDALRRALAGRPEQAPVTIHLHPADAAAVAGTDAVPAGVTITPDPGLAPGDSVLVHPVGRYEVLLQEGLRRAQEVLGR